MLKLICLDRYEYMCTYYLINGSLLRYLLVRSRLSLIAGYSRQAESGEIPPIRGFV